MFLRLLTVVVCLRITSPYTKFHDEFLNMKSPFENGEVGEADLNKEVERTISNLSGEEERGQWARAADARMARMASQSAAVQLTTALHMPCRVAAETACNSSHKAKLL